MQLDINEDIDWETLAIDDARMATALLAKDPAVVDFIAEEVTRSATETDAWWKAPLVDVFLYLVCVRLCDIIDSDKPT